MTQRNLTLSMLSAFTLVALAFSAGSASDLSVPASKCIAQLQEIATRYEQARASGEMWPQFDEIAKASQTCESLLKKDAHPDALLAEMDKYLARISCRPKPAVPPAEPTCPAHYYYQEGWARCVYDHTFYKKLKVDYPNSPVRDDALWEMSRTVYRYYECEGQLLCSIENGIVGEFIYLEEMPKGRHAQEAAASIRQELSHLDDGSEKSPDEDAGGLRASLDRLEAVTKKMSPELAKDLQSAIAQARRLIGVVMDGYVPNAETAIKIAVAVWLPIYGEKKIEAEKPYKATLKNGVWTVEGSLPKNMLGGTAVAEIVKESGKILRVTHGK